jgi:putative metallohydrolase (TIGR04338 family)
MVRIAANAVYQAEQIFENALNNRDKFPTAIVFGSTVNVPDQRRFGDYQHVRKYVNYVLAHPHIRHVYPTRSLKPVKVRVRKGPNKAHYERSTSTIALPDNRFGMSEVTVLHELAHHLSDTGGHDALFIKALDTLIETMMAPEAILLYREAVSNLTTTSE